MRIRHRTTIATTLALVAASFIGAAPGVAREYPWCGQLYGGTGGDAGRTCGFDSWTQCRATTGLQDGFCLPNPAYRPVVEAPVSDRTRHRRHSSR